MTSLTGWDASVAYFRVRAKLLVIVEAEHVAEDAATVEVSRERSRLAPHRVENMRAKASKGV